MDEAFTKRFRWCAAQLLAAVGIVLPYQPRILYVRFLSFLIHAPYRAFGWLARWILRSLEIEPATIELPPSTFAEENSAPVVRSEVKKAVVLFSGGTDSTCAAYLLARSTPEIHLLTFYESATKNSPIPTKNIEKLRQRFPQNTFLSSVISIDTLLKQISYSKYFSYLFHYRSLMLATCGFSSLSWHVRTVIYCLEHDIKLVADGLTKELVHFPGHMDEVIELLREFYKKFGIEYVNPVRSWGVPEDRQFVDQMIVNMHGGEFMLGDANTSSRKTTGQFLFREGFFPSPNVKGSKLDFSMQHDCYPFALYNIVAFWGFLSYCSYPEYCHRVARLMREKLEDAAEWVEDYKKHGKESTLAKCFAGIE